MNRQVLERAITFIDSWLRYRYERLEVPGFVVAIAHKGQLQFKQAYGYANLERQKAMTTDHVFRIASHSKTFTATVLMQLAEENLLSIDDPVGKHLAWINEHRDGRLAQVTIRQLMSHGAGMIRDGFDANFWQLARTFPDIAQLKCEILQADLILDGNTQMKYSNYGYSLLGCLIESVTGTPYNQCVQERIVEPLGLGNTGPEFCQAIVPRLVTGYSRRDWQKQRLPITERIDTQAMSAATGFYSTAEDLCQYFAAHFLKSGKLLKDESKKEMQRTQWRLKNSTDNQEYGLGVGIDYGGERRLFGHGGGFPGQLTRTFCDGQNNLVVVVLCNSLDGEPYAMGKGIYSVINHFQKSAEAGDHATRDRLQKFEGRFMSLWRDINIVESGKYLRAVDPNTWFPFGKDQALERLEQVGDCQLRIADADGYRSEGELVQYEFDQSGGVNSIRYASYDMWPEGEYNKRMAQIKSEIGRLDYDHCQSDVSASAP